MKALHLLVGCKMPFRGSSDIFILEVMWHFLVLGRRGHLFDYPSAVILYEMCVEEPMATVSAFWSFLLISVVRNSNNHEPRVPFLTIDLCSLQVQNVRNQEKLKYPPYPLSTLELQKRASRYFRMSSEHTMKVSKISSYWFIFPYRFQYLIWAYLGSLIIWLFYLLVSSLSIPGGWRTLSSRIH